MKTDRMVLPAGMDKVVGLVAQLMLNDVRKIVLDFDIGDVEVRWMPTFSEELGEVHDVDPGDLLENVRISETPLTAASIPLNAAATELLTNECMMLAAERGFGVGWLVSDTAVIKNWLGIPPMMPLNQLMGMPIYTVDNLPQGTLLLLGAKTFGAPLRAVSTIRRISLEKHLLDKPHQNTDEGEEITQNEVDHVGRTDN